MQIFEELKRRNVLRVAAAYAAVAWLTVQLAEFATSTFGAPDWVLRTFTVLLVLGLPIALVLAWAFQVTPAGIQKSGSGRETSAPPGRANVATILLVGVVVVAAAVLQFMDPELPRREAAKPVGGAGDSGSLHADIAFAEDTPLAFVGAATLGNGRRAFTISPDGRLLVYSGTRDGRYALFLRDLGSHEVRELPGTENGYDPFFSPNGQWLAFFAGNQLRRVDTVGGTAFTLTEVTNSSGGTWLGNDRILAVADEGGTLVLYDLAGDRREWRERTAGGAPHALPGGRAVLWANGTDLFWYRLEDAQPKQLPLKGSDPRFAGGLLLFTEGSTLYAARFDPETGEVGSVPVPVETGVRTEVYRFSQWALSADGRFLYAPGSAAAQSRMAWVGGPRPEVVDFPQRFRGSFEISPDGRQLAVMETVAGSTDLWLYDFAGGAPRKLTFEGDLVGNLLLWMPDGGSIVYRRGEGSSARHYRLSLATGASEPLAPGLSEEGLVFYSVSGDGRFLAGGLDAVDSEKLILYDLLDQQTEEVDLRGLGNWGFSVSPSADAVVYTSPISGEYQNYLQTVPASGAQYQVSRKGGAEEPRWSRDGRRIYYRNGQRIMVVDVDLQPEIKLGEPRVFFDGGFVNVGGRSYDIAPDESRALVIQEPEATATSIRLITGWLQRVEQKVAESARP